MYSFASEYFRTNLDHIWNLFPIGFKSGPARALFVSLTRTIWPTLSILGSKTGVLGQLIEGKMFFMKAYYAQWLKKNCACLSPISSNGVHLQMGSVDAEGRGQDGLATKEPSLAQVSGKITALSPRTCCHYFLTPRLSYPANADRNRVHKSINFRCLFLSFSSAFYKIDMCTLRYLIFVIFSQKVQSTLDNSDSRILQFFHPLRQFWYFCIY